MARGTPSYSTASLPAATDAAAQLDAFLPILESAITAYQSNATDAWEVYAALDTSLASRDTVYRSVGDRTLGSGAGDTSAFVRLERTSSITLQFSTYQDWSTASNTGVRQSSPAAVSLGAGAATSLEYFFCYNEYEFHCVLNEDSGAAWRYFGWGVADRSHVPPAATGIAFLDSAVTTGSSVVCALDRDISSDITVGQYVWITNRTAAGDPLEPADVEVVEVTAVSSTPNITLAQLNNNYAAGAIVGFDPIGCFCWTAGNTAATPLQCSNDASGASGGQNAFWALPFDDIPNEAGEDPEAITGLYRGQYAYINDGTADFPSWRGRLTASSFWGVNGQTGPTADVMRDIVTGVGYRPFPGLLLDNRLLALYDPAA